MSLASYIPVGHLLQRGGETCRYVYEIPATYIATNVSFFSFEVSAPYLCLPPNNFLGPIFCQGKSVVIPYVRLY